MSDATEDFRAFIIAQCATDPGHVIADGKWHRFRIADTRHKGSKPGRYLLHADGRPNGIFMDWRNGVRHKWRAGTAVESIDRAEIERRRAARDARLAAGFKAAAETAKAFWSSCAGINGASHPYLDAKGIAPHGTRVGSGKRFGLGDEPCVIVPLSGPDGEAMSLQAIRGDGERRFWPDSTHERSHFMVGADDGQSPLIFCEGFSTAASLNEATGWPVVMAVNTGNLMHVARWAVHRWAGREMFVAGDDDWHLVDHPQTQRNVGRESAEAMARTMGAKLVMPNMHGLVTAGGDDFNDMAREYGAEAVREAFAHPTSPAEVSTDDDRLIRATPFAWRPTAEIPRRQWLYGKHLLRKFVSLDVAAGGVGKSSLKIGEALAMASGRDLYDKGLPEGALTVWMWNLEDPHDEIERRLHATAQRFGIGSDELGDRLYVDSGRDQPLVMATEGPDGAIIVRPVVQALIAEMVARKVDVLQIDPFISSHQVSENDNNAIDIVAREWNVVAERTGAAINLVHHVRKQNGAEATADSARGASALIGKARSVLVYNRMSTEEAEMLGVPPDQRRFYFRVDNDKANLAPPEAGDWYRMNNEDLANGDSVGVACSWHAPDLFDGITARHLYDVQNAIGNGEWRENVQTKDKWAGVPVARVLDLNLDDKTQRKRVSRLLSAWLAEGALEVVDKDDYKGVSRKFVVVGRWVER